MPIQAPQWTDYLSCPVCCREFGPPPRSPISLACGHTLCRHCLKHLHRKQCPFDQTVIQLEPSELVVNTAVLQLAGYTPPPQPYHPPAVQALTEPDRRAYDTVVKCMEHLALYLKYGGNVSGSSGGCRLSRPMQRKLVTLVQCATTDAEGRGRAARAARSLGERTVTELILQHQNPQQLSANLWAAVRARGCQFLGPAMQEEVLKLVLLALEDGSALSRKVLVMFVVQRLEPHFPQASKTSIGHVVQLLYRASCFKVSKRECDSSLMQLKEEFRTYECLRREHDAQIVQIATEAGLRIAPDQWSALLYGDTAHKSHMQSIIDKLQTPQSFAQSVQELFIALQRTGDPAHLVTLSPHLDRLAAIEPSPDAKNPSWQELATIMCSLQEVVSGLVHFLHQHAAARDSNHNTKHDHVAGQPSPQQGSVTPTHNNKYKVLMCRDAATRSFCPRGANCTFAHSEEEMDRHRNMLSGNATNGNFPVVPSLALPLAQGPLPHGVMPPLYSPQYPPPMPPQPMHRLDNYQAMNAMGPPLPPPDMMPPPTEFPPEAGHNVDLQNTQYPPPPLVGQAVGLNQNGVMVGLGDRYVRYPREDVLYNNRNFSHLYRPITIGSSNMPDIATSPSIYVSPPPPDTAPEIAAYAFDERPPELQLPDYQLQATVTFTAPPRDHRVDNAAAAAAVAVTPWVPPPPQEVFNFDGIRNSLTHPAPSEDMFNNARAVVPADRIVNEISSRADDHELEEELQALERRIDTEYKSTD